MNDIVRVQLNHYFRQIFHFKFLNNEENNNFAVEIHFFSLKINSA